MCKNVASISASVLVCFCVQVFSADPKNPSIQRQPNMSKENITLLRKSIYNNQLSTSTNYAQRYPNREVVVRPEIVKIHKMHRVETLLLLLDITKGANPTDARTAGAIAIALEDDPGTAAVWADISLDRFDDNTDISYREILVRDVEKRLSNAKKQLEANEGK